jgi:hypothetical protein
MSLMTKAILQRRPRPVDRATSINRKSDFARWSKGATEQSRLLQLEFSMMDRGWILVPQVEHLLLREMQGSCWLVAGKLF